MSFRTQFIDVAPDVRISALISHPSHLSRQAKLPTVVFLHFWGGSSRTWSLVGPIVAQTYPTACIDFRGWGQSTGPKDVDAYSISALAGDVKVVLESLHLEAVVLVGISMGAKVAQLLATSLPAYLVRGLVLVSPAPPTPLERVRVEVCDRIPGARMEVVSGSGHLSPLDAPEGIAQHILGFIQGLTIGILDIVAKMARNTRVFCLHCCCASIDHDPLLSPSACSP